MKSSTCHLLNVKTFHTGCDGSFQTVTGGRSEPLPGDLAPPRASTATDDVIYYVRRVTEDLLNFTFVRITEVFKEAADETFTDAHWSLRLQCIFLVYKGSCLWRDWQLMPAWLWISPCVIECWCEMASQERSLCSRKDLLLNQNAGEKKKKKKDATKQPNIQRRGFSISRCSFIRLNNSSNTAESTSQTGKKSLLLLSKGLRLCWDWNKQKLCKILCLYLESCWKSPYLLSQWVYGDESLLFLFIVQRSHHLCRASQRNSINFKKDLRNRVHSAGWQQERDWTPRQPGRFVKVKNCFCRRDVMKYLPGSAAVTLHSFQRC